MRALALEGLRLPRMRTMGTLALLVAWLLPGRALAHAGHLHWAEIGTTWTWDPWVILPLALSGGLYAAGTVRLWRRAGIGRGVRPGQAGCFALGWALLVLALVTPLHWLGERLFVAHMVEHEILMAASAPLLMVARPVGAMLWALPARGRRAAGSLGRMPVLARTWAVLTNAPVATLVHGVALWAWHVPVLYEAALADPWIHWLQHLSFLSTALLFWRALLQGRERERAYGAAVFYLFATSLHTGFLGILLAVARQPIYPLQTGAAPEWGLTPLEDQQLAGLVMWIPAGLVYAGAALALAGLWIARSSSDLRPDGRRAAASSGALPEAGGLQAAAVTGADLDAGGRHVVAARSGARPHDGDAPRRRRGPGLRPRAALPDSARSPRP
jgi:cytochrome c oxidase assembly factor CtaG